MGIPAGSRLRTALQFQRVFASGGRSSDRCFTVLARANGGLPSRLGLAIAKKHLPRAVDRNRVKRIVRESFRHHAAQLTGWDIVVLSRRDTRTQPNPVLHQSLDRHWHRVGRSSHGGH